MRVAFAKAFPTIFAALAAAAPAMPARSAVLEPSVLGPAAVVSGRVVRFHAHGFHAGSNVSVVLSPADKPSCCAIRIASSFGISLTGDAVLTFRMPRYFLSCPSPPHCRKVRWSPREPAEVTVFGYLEQAITTTLVER